jgi:hypothetical protein
MYNVNPDDILTRVVRYELLRDNDRVFIDVHAIMHGKTDARCVAIPTNVLSTWAERKYWGTGDTEAEALDACLARVRGLSLETLFPDTLAAPGPQEQGQGQ